MDNINNGLLEEEQEMISVFAYEMDQYGRKGFYSFYDNISNGYFIYKEDNIWVLNINDNGKTIKSIKYTNVYNLCLDILNELKIDDFYFKRRDLKIPRGTRVIITKESDCPIDEIKQGIIIGSSISDNGNTQPERIYQVLGSDGKLYDGLYGLRIYGDICFRTFEDFIKDSEQEIVDNTDTITELYDRNLELYCIIEDLKGEKERYIELNSFKK